MQSKNASVIGTTTTDCMRIIANRNNIDAMTVRVSVEGLITPPKSMRYYTDYCRKISSREIVILPQITFIRTFSMPAHVAHHWRARKRETFYDLHAFTLDPW